MIKELKSQVLAHHTWGEDIIKAFMVLVDKIYMPDCKLVFITTDVWRVLSAHVNSSYQQANCGRGLNLKDTMDVAMKTVNFICARTFQRKLFCIQVKDTEAEHGKLQARFP